ncbi:MAG: polyphosphate kinase 2 family protein [Verrucomicrobiales bacterium]
MKTEIKIEDYQITKGKGFELKDHANALAKDLYEDKKDYEKELEDYREEIDDLQNMMYAHDKHSLLLVFQAMDAAGKDGTIRHVMSGVNAHGVEVSAFKRPSDLELEHDYLWRTNLALPPRGTVGIFNRSYYEEVLVCKVHPEIVTKYQKLPAGCTEDMEQLWKNRYRAIRDYERYLTDNGTIVMKFFLNVSKDEQKRRFLDRIDRQEKNWKFSDGDIKERGYWDDYMEAYETAIRETATADCPWHVIPADDKKNMRLIVSKLILEKLENMEMAYPELPEKQKALLADCRAKLESEKD